MLNAGNQKKLFWWSFGITLGVIGIIAILVSVFGNAPQHSAQVQGDDSVQPSGWTDVSGEAFQARFPESPEKQEQELQNAGGPAIHQVTYAAGDQQRAQFVLVSSRSEAFDFDTVADAAVEELLTASLDAMVQVDESHRLITSSPTTHHGRPAIGFEIWNNASNFRYRGIITLAGSSMYQAFITYPGEAYPQADFAYFIESFQLK